VKQLKEDADRREREAAPFVQSHDSAKARLETAKREENTAKTAKNAADNKVRQAQNALAAAQKKEAAEKPWYVGAAEVVGKGMNATVNFGKKVFKMTDWDKMEKAVTAASKALGLAKNPPDKIISALDTTGKYFGAINNTKTAAGNLKELLAAGAKYKAARTDSEKADAIAAVSIATLNSVETLVGIKGGVITSLATSLGNQFLTALIKAVANVTKLMREGTYSSLWLGEILDRGWDEDLWKDGKGFSELGYRLTVTDRKTQQEVKEAIEAAKVLKNP
jgi:hypothetical protein